VNHTACTAKHVRIFKDDAANPVNDWNIVYVPYVTGDIYFGSKPNGTVPNVAGTFQFVGKSNMLKFIARIVPTYKDAETVILAGSSAGGIGAMLNLPYLTDAYIDLKNGASVVMLNDAGPYFDDEHIESCLQKRFRELWGLNDSLPKDCAGCFDSDGGGLAAGVLAYLADKYPDMRGGLIDSDQDDIMKFFYSEGLEDCSFIENPVMATMVYPSDRYPAALKDLLSEHLGTSISSYIWSGILHQNLFRTTSGDRYFQKNGLDRTVAEWLSSLLSGKVERIGVVK